MNNQKIIIHGEDTINAIGKFNSRHTKPVIRKEDGKVFSSIRDAATKANANYHYMVMHLTHPEKYKAVKGFHYAYLKDVVDNPDDVFAQLRHTAKERDRYKAEAEANADAARKWHEYQAQLAAEAAAEAKRQEEARIAEEKRQKKIAGLEAKIARNEQIHANYSAKADRAMDRVFKLKAELASLTGEAQENGGEA